MFLVMNCLSNLILSETIIFSHAQPSPSTSYGTIPSIIKNGLQYSIQLTLINLPLYTEMNISLPGLSSKYSLFVDLIFDWAKHKNHPLPSSCLPLISPFKITAVAFDFVQIANQFANMIPLPIRQTASYFQPLYDNHTFHPFSNDIVKNSKNFIRNIDSYEQEGTCMDAISHDHVKEYPKGIFDELETEQNIDEKYAEEQKQVIENENWKEDINYEIIFAGQKVRQTLALQRIKKEIEQTMGEVEQQLIRRRQSGLIDSSYNFQNSQKQQLRLTFNNQDYKKLRPGTDLNDAIILNFLNLFKNFMLPRQSAAKVHIFNSYFIPKLLPFIEQIAPGNQVFGEQWSQKAKKEVRANYKNVQRWTRKDDIFSKEVLIFPINMFNHWFCVLVINPDLLFNPQQVKRKCQILFCDSMFQKRPFVVSTIRMYLQMQLLQKKGVDLYIDQTNSPDYQLLLPRQSNTHDCGLYTIAYIQELLLSQIQYQNMQSIPSRIKCNIIPRYYLESARNRILKFLIDLCSSNNNQEQIYEVVQEYISQRKEIFQEYTKEDQFIDQKQFQKFIGIYKNIFSTQVPTDPQQLQQWEYKYLLFFYYHTELNFYAQELPPKPENSRRLDLEWSDTSSER